MSSFTVDLRLHSITGLPSSDSTVELRLRYGKLEQSCATAESYDGMVFLGAWTRLVVEEDNRELQFEVRQHVLSWGHISGSRVSLVVPSLQGQQENVHSRGLFFPSKCYMHCRVGA